MKYHKVLRSTTKHQNKCHIISAIDYFEYMKNNNYILYYYVQ